MLITVVEPEDWAMIDAMMTRYSGEFAPSDHECVAGFDRGKRVSFTESTAKKIKNIAVRAERLWSHEQGMLHV